MSKTREEILQALRGLTADSVEIYSGIVKTVSESDATCEVELLGGLVVPVRLRATIDGLKGIVPVPKANSNVVVAEIDAGSGYTLLRASELQKVLIDVPEIALTCDKVVINKGDNKGIVKLEELKKNLDALKDYIKDTLEPAISDGITAVGVGDAANGTTGATTFKGKVSAKRITFSNMENTKIKH